MASVCPVYTRASLLKQIKDKIPAKISFDQINLMPTRKDFLDPKLRSAFAAQVAKSAPILFMGNTIMDRHEYIAGTQTYFPYMFGVMPCGTKITVVLTNVEVVFDIGVPAELTPNAYETILRSQLGAQGINYKSITDIKFYPLHGFYTEKQPYKRVTFNNLNDRKSAIMFIRTQNAERKGKNITLLQTASDDCGANNYYFSKVAREYRFAPSGWNRMTNYTVSPSAGTTELVFRVSVNDFKKLTSRQISDYSRPGHALNNIISHDPILSCGWDIETFSTVQNGVIPTPADTTYTIFMMCTAFSPHYISDPMFTVCCVDVETNARPGNDLTIICGNERGVLEAHMKVLAAMTPDILIAFNGGKFDWPLYIEKCRRENLLCQLRNCLSAIPDKRNDESAVRKWNFKKEKVKIDATSSHEIDAVAQFPGILDTDALPIFLGMYAKAEVGKASSLNWFLEQNGLESKEDMPYKRMFKLYERALNVATIRSCHCGDAQSICGVCTQIIPSIDCKQTGILDDNEIVYGNELHDCIKDKCCYCGKKAKSAIDMAQVGYYCTVDSIRPHQLYVRRNIIPDKRTISNMAYVSLYDAFYRANGMKVCNLIGAYSHKRGIAFSNANSGKSDSEKDHFPGAWVFPPNRGLHSDGKKIINGVLVQERPIGGLDVASLYPSLMICYDISTDRTVNTRERAEELMALGYSLHPIGPFPYHRGDKNKDAPGNLHLTGEAWMVRHNGVFSDADTTIVDRYEKYVTITTNGVRKEYLAADEPMIDEHTPHTRRVSYKAVRGRKALPNESMGIFPYIVKKLFDKRVPIKAEFVRYHKLKEDMQRFNVKEIADNKLIDGIPSGKMLTEKMIEHEITVLESIQKGLKLLANTFYGKSGDFRSAIYNLFVAAGTTTAGQMTIKAVAEFVIKRGYTVQYGDTDSLYLSPPDSAFITTDAKYHVAMEIIEAEYEGVNKILHMDSSLMTEREKAYKDARTAARLVWWDEQVRITMKSLDGLKEEVSDFLLDFNKTTFINMAYEEIMYPSALCGKKKYFGTAHIENTNFYPRPQDLFVRGIEVVKQGRTLVGKNLGFEFMSEAMSPGNERDLMEIADDKIRKFYVTKMDPKLFVQSARYKPDKQNVPVKKFYQRMKETYARLGLAASTDKEREEAALYEPPEPGDKFMYVVVIKEERFTIQGNRIDIKKGDKMEYLRVYNATQNSPNPMKIDTSYYTKGEVVGIFARFIAYHDMFQPPVGMYDVDDKEQYKEMDKYCANRAIEYLTQICDSITGRNPGALAQIGRNYRKIYSNVNKIARNDLVARYGCAGELLHSLNPQIEGDAAMSTKIIDQLISSADEIVGDSAAYARAVVKRITTGIDGKSLNIFRAYRAYCDTYARRRVIMCDANINNIIATARSYSGTVAMMVISHERSLIALIDDMRTVKTEESANISDDALNVINTFSDEETIALKELHKCMIKLTVVKIIRANVLAVTKAIQTARADAANLEIAPPISMTEIIAESKAVPMIDDYVWK